MSPAVTRRDSAAVERPIPSGANQLTRLSTVSTMSRLETSPTSSRPASTANFILMPLMGTTGFSAVGPGLPSRSSPGGAAAAAGSWLAIAQAGRQDRWGQVASQVRHLFHGGVRGGGEDSISPAAQWFTVHRRSTFLPIQILWKRAGPEGGLGTESGSTR